MFNISFRVSQDKIIAETLQKHFFLYENLQLPVFCYDKF